jgi:hypothetical protein
MGADGFLWRVTLSLVILAAIMMALWLVLLGGYAQRMDIARQKLARQNPYEKNNQ